MHKLIFCLGCAIGGNGAHASELDAKTTMNYWKVSMEPVNFLNEA